ncbi:PREDICTED: serine/threonine-protein kinase MHK-like isoform X2 [Brassica oleracea var. oleracea]|uniref:serine/threonine-protein kinase MHK-like isoform X2 n=1 Tax=Brassica oleracea var. oleracea TaxID=109376 RepID=UPI0006A6EE93|nr:PREDICTED: serine/threonine-protein kinase MHK-like isoform X2 [Brassica oleracea var. oleracea]
MANSKIHLSIFECMDHNLYQITQEREQRPFSEGKISTFMSQMLQVLAHMHKNSYFHRQLKPTISSRLLTLDWLAKLHLCFLENVSPVSDRRVPAESFE